MKIELTDKQREDQKGFRDFSKEEIAPHADRFDREEQISRELIEKISKKGYLGAVLPPANGGMDMITFGLLNEEIGWGCSSVRSLLTVHNMVLHALLKWGTESQKTNWIPKLLSGEEIAAFALTEPHVGSDAKGVETVAELTRGNYVLNGRKKWITFGQIADLFLVFARYDGKQTAFIVSRDSPGLSIQPISGMLGTRASMMADLHLENCTVPGENLLGKKGFGFISVASSALDLGRYSVAWGCVGIAQACLEASISYTRRRKQFQAYLKDHQLIRQMITDMITGVKAARLLCYQSGYLKDVGDPSSIMETLVAKYFSSTMVMNVASNTVQIHGAHGCSGDSPAQRYLRDAKTMEIIEGTTQIHQVTIAKYGYDTIGDDRVVLADKKR